MSDREIDARLRDWPVARLATLQADGRAHLVPIVFAHSDDALWMPIDGKPKDRPVARELERVRNLQSDPRVTLLLDHYDDDWNALWWLRVEGEAALHPVDASDPSDCPEARAVTALRAKYPQYLEVPLFRGAPRLVRIVIARVRSWCAVAARGDQF